MFRHGVTISLGDYQSERVEVNYPFDSLGPDQTYDDVVNWVDTRLRAEIDKIVRREAARGNYIDPPFIGEVGPATPATASGPAVTLPPLVQPNIPVPAGGPRTAPATAERKAGAIVP